MGVKGDFMERTEELLEAGADIIVVDVAHGHSQNAISAVRNIKKAFPGCEIIAGNVATAAGAQDLINAGVDAVKVGVGSGSICITRVINRIRHPTADGSHGLRPHRQGQRHPHNI